MSSGPQIKSVGNDMNVLKNNKNSLIIWLNALVTESILKKYTNTLKMFLKLILTLKKMVFLLFKFLFCAIQNYDLD